MAPPRPLFSRKSRKNVLRTMPVSGEEEYPKRPSDSIRSEHPAIGAAGADADVNRPAALRAMPFVRSLGLIDVNPCVDTTTVELDTDEAASLHATSGGVLGPLVAGKVQILTGHRLFPAHHADDLSCYRRR